MSGKVGELKRAPASTGRETRSGLPREVSLLAAMLSASATVVLAVRFADLSHWTADDASTMAAMTVAVALAERFSIRLRLRTEHMNFSLTEAVAVAALMLARPSVLTMSVALGVFLAQIAKRNSFTKVAFNVGQFVLALTVAQVVYRLFHPLGIIDPKALLATAVAMSAYAVVNAGLVSLVIALVERRSFRSILLPPLPGNAFHFGGNTALGVAGTALWNASPLTVPVFAALLVVAYVSYHSVLHALPAAQRIG